MSCMLSSNSKWEGIQMSIRSISAALTAASLAFGSVAVQAAPVERASAPSAEQSELRSSSLLWILVLLAVIGGVLVLAGGDDDKPVSS